ncbi:MAG TPA: hypothetical protein VFI15_10760 [Candidatus Limnocylindrales bacterium]|nr:hypothetical protein [Candidatus Limnocylindrales bacterium]
MPEPDAGARRLAVMPDRPNRPNRPNRPRLALLLPGLVLSLAACAGSAAAPSATSPTEPPGTTQPIPTLVPGDPGSGGAGGGVTDPGSGSGGGSGGNTGSGTLPGGGIGGLFPGDPNQDPLFGQASYLTPSPGLINQHPVNVQLVRAVQNDDGTVIADLRWWSGVAPCSQLDHVEIAKDEAARTIRFTVIEGSGKGDVACIDIAQLSATTVGLGTLAAGTWKLSAEGDAPEINLDVQ